METITKICPAFGCGNTFETKSNYNQIYCSHKCYRREKVRRRKQKLGDEEKHNHVEIDSRMLSTLRFPSEEQLNVFATVVTEDRPVEVIGMNVMWTPPHGVVFVKQQERKNNEEVWLMFKQDTPDVMEMFQKA